jgi:hypothetical protein
MGFASLYPSYEDCEPEHASADSTKTPTFAILQKYNHVNLAVLIGTTYPYHAAIESKIMKLTAPGEHDRRLVAGGLI